MTRVFSLCLFFILIFSPFTYGLEIVPGTLPNLCKKVVIQTLALKDISPKHFPGKSWAPKQTPQIENEYEPKIDPLDPLQQIPRQDPHTIHHWHFPGPKIPKDIHPSLIFCAASVVENIY